MAEKDNQNKGIPDPTTAPNGIAGIFFWACQAFKTTVSVFVQYPYQSFMVCIISIIFSAVGIGSYQFHNYYKEKLALQRLQTPQYKAERFKQISHDNLQIDRITEKLRIDTLATRAVVFEFHNGTYSLVGRDFYKYSNISESVQIGIEKQKPQLQNIPMTLLPPEWMEAILKRKLLKVCLEKTPDSSHTDTLKNLGLHAVMIQPMHDPVTNKPVGFVGIGVMHHRDDFMDAKNIFALKRAADIIEELLIKWKNQ